MPNDCFNTLRITGPAERLAAFREGIRDPDGRGLALFQSHLPMPPDIADDPTGQARHDWMLGNWGVSHGGDYDTRIVDNADPETLTIEFFSAWRPPSGGLQNLADKFPELRFENTYDEPNVDLHGRSVYRADGGHAPDEYDRVVRSLRLAVRKAAAQLDQIPEGHDLPDSAWEGLQNLRSLVDAGMEALARDLRHELEQELEP